MRIRDTAALAAALVALAGPAGAIEPNMVDSAKTIQSACVSRGEDSRVCSCGVGLAYAKLDPKVFRLMPQVEPLMDLKDKSAQITGLLSLAMQNGLTLSDIQSAADTIRANRETVNAICKPLTAVKTVKRTP